MDWYPSFCKKKSASGENCFPKIWRFGEGDRRFLGEFWTIWVTILFKVFVTGLVGIKFLPKDYSCSPLFAYYFGHR